LQEAARETQALNGCAHGSRGCPAGQAAGGRPPTVCLSGAPGPVVAGRAL